MCDFNGTRTCTPIHDTNGNLVQNGQVFVPGTVKYNSVGEVLTGTPYVGNIIPASQFSSQYAAMIKYFTPGYRGSFNHPIYNNGHNDEQQINFQDTYTFTKNQYVARVDYNFGPKANAFFRYVDDRQQESQGFGIFSGNSFPVLPQYRKKPGKSYGWSLVNVISPTLTNEATVGWLALDPGRRYRSRYVQVSLRQEHPGLQLHRYLSVDQYSRSGSEYQYRRRLHQHQSLSFWLDLYRQHGGRHG